MYARHRDWCSATLIATSEQAHYHLIRARGRGRTDFRFSNYNSFRSRRNKFDGYPCPAPLSRVNPATKAMIGARIKYVVSVTLVLKLNPGGGINNGAKQVSNPHRIEPLPPYPRSLQNSGYGTRVTVGLPSNVMMYVLDETRKNTHVTRSHEWGW